MGRGVMFSRASAGFAVALAVSLVVKIGVAANVGAARPEAFANHATAMLRAGGFDAAVQPRKFGLLIYGARGRCRVMLGDYPPHGTFADPIRAAAQPIGTLRFRYRDTVYDRAPKATPLFDFYIVRELRRIGVAAARRPIVAVAASPGCDLTTLDWTQLSPIPD